MTTVYYKWLREGQKPTHADAEPWVPGEWRSVTGKIEACHNGLHACRAEHLPEWINQELWVLEPGKRVRVVDAGDKVVMRKARIVERLRWNDTVARLFAADCAEHVLHLFERERPDDDRPRKAIEATRAFARGEIDRAAWAAARDAAWAAAWAADRDADRAAAWAADRAAARDAACAAAWAADRDADWAADWAAAWAAAWAAERAWQGNRLLEYAKGERT